MKNETLAADEQEAHDLLEHVWKMEDDRKAAEKAVRAAEAKLREAKDALSAAVLLHWRRARGLARGAVLVVGDRRMLVTQVELNTDRWDFASSTPVAVGLYSRDDGSGEWGPAIGRTNSYRIDVPMYAHIPDNY